jgi:hypothetical protein
MFQKSKHFLGFLAACVLLSSFGGAYATWRFTEKPPESISGSQSITISEFVWQPEEILPSVTPGQNFLDLYDSILNNVKAGLNSNKGVLERAVNNSKTGLVHCSQNVQGGNLKHLFITQETRELEFIMEHVSDTNFNLYIYKEVDTNGAMGVTRIEVYKTILKQENGTWDGEETQLGYATLQYFPNTNVRAIDVSTWSRTL